jgi:hypothetical protein
MSLTFERVREHIGAIPTMHPRPTFDNINNAVIHLVRKLQQLPAPHQSTRNGYAGKILSPAEYALLDTQAWRDWPYPGPHHTFPPNSTREIMEQEKTVWAANTEVYNSEQNVDRAIIAALDIAVPDDFKYGGAATNGWSGDMTSRAIIASLKEKYGKPGPADKAKIEAIFMKPYNPNRPIESMLKELETARMMSILAKIPYTMDQLLDKALTKIQVTNQFRNALVDWATYVAENPTVNNNWNDFKDHFIQAYTVNQAALTMAQAGYHSAANTQEEYPDDDSLESIQASLVSIQMANNASVQTTNDQLSALTANTQQQFAQMAQQMAMLAAQSQQLPMLNTHMPQPYQMPHNHHAQMAQQPYQQPNIPAYIPAQRQQPNNYTTYDRGQGNQRNSGRGRRNSRGGGRRNNNNHYGNIPAPPSQIQHHNPYSGNIPPPANLNANPYAATGRAPYSNTTKHFPNWNYCYTCGFDVEDWHTGTTCPHPKPGHQPQCNRQTYQAYQQAGHRPSAKAQHKTALPPST